MQGGMMAGNYGGRLSGFCVEWRLFAEVVKTEVWVEFAGVE